MTVADKALPNSIDTFASWGLGTRGHTAMTGKISGKGDVEDGIFILSALMSGGAWIDAPLEDRHKELVAAAVAATHGQTPFARTARLLP